MFQKLPYGITVHSEEGDMEYVYRLHDFLLAEYQAQFADHETFGPVGSQVFNIWPFSIGRENLQIFDETYMGIQIQGPKQLVDHIVTSMRANGLL